MKQPITVGRIALALLVVVGLSAATGIGAAAPIDGKGNDVCPCGETVSYATPSPNNIIAASLDGKGNDPFPTASAMAPFPINNATLTVHYYVIATAHLSVETLSLADAHSVLNSAFTALAWGQDMDPY